MRPLKIFTSFLVLTLPLLLHAQSHEFGADRVASFFRDDSLPVSCNVRLGIDWYHGDMITAAIPNILNPGECCSLCRNQTGCRAWIWRSARSHCWLKHTANPPTSCPTCVGGVLHDVVPEICHPREEAGWSGPNLEVRIGTTLGDCCDACYQNDNCTGWTFRNSNSPRCFLKQRNGAETTCMDCTSGENERIKLPNETCNLQSGVDWYGNDINVQPYTNASAAGCCDMCRNRPDCRAWWYETSLHHCYLKYAVGRNFSCTDCVGGIVE